MEAAGYITWIRFSVQLLIAESVFLIGRQRRGHFRIRIISALLMYILLSGGYFFLIKQIPGNSPAVHACFFIGLFTLTIFGVAFCFDLPWLEILFVGTGGYATEHIAFAAARIIQYMTGWYENRIGIAAEYLVFRFFIYIIVAAVIYLFLVRKNREKEEFAGKDIRMVEMALLILLSAIVLSAFYTSEEDFSLLSRVICPLYSMLCCFLVLIIEYYVFRENRLSREKETMEQLLQMAHAQQKRSKEAIDIINMKCHDLKHQMKHLESLEDDGERSEYLEEMRSAVSIYDAIYHTGCEALDYLLREKTLLSDEYHIVFSCMVDGKAVSFMNKADLYALMGNALDNAIESAAREAEEHRIISLNIRHQGRMVMLHLENSCSESPVFYNGLPITTKKDKNYHGFGVQSMRYIVQNMTGK